jgi:hypothetical protein
MKIERDMRGHPSPKGERIGRTVRVMREKDMAGKSGELER